MESNDRIKAKVPVYQDFKSDSHIPKAFFIENIENFCKEYGLLNVVESLKNGLNKFKFTESQFTRFKDSMSVKIPEIEKALETITYLKKNNDEEKECNFLLNDGIYCTATATNNEKGNLYIYLYNILS